MLTYTEEKEIYPRAGTAAVFIGALGLRQLSQEAVQGADALLHRAYGVDGDKLVGLIRVPGDSETLTQIHYMLVHPNYQRQGIAGKMLELIKEKYKDYLYIESMPKDKSNVPLYVKHRFTMTENGARPFKSAITATRSKCKDYKKNPGGRQSGFFFNERTIVQEMVWLVLFLATDHQPGQGSGTAQSQHGQQNQRERIGGLRDNSSRCRGCCRCLGGSGRCQGQK